MPRPSKAWKQAERRAARLFGSQRTPLSGSNGGITASDSLHSKLFLETKYRVRHAAWTLFDSVRKLAQREGKIPVVCLHENRRKGDLIIIHSDDLIEVLREYATARGIRLIEPETILDQDLAS